MTDTATTAVATLLAAAPQGPGNTLRIVLLVSMVGGALLAWLLLRGYRQGDQTTEGTGGTPGARGGEEGARSASEGPAARTGNGSGDANA